jgi:hypothetical protein
MVPTNDKFLGGNVTTLRDRLTLDFLLHIILKLKTTTIMPLDNAVINVNAHILKLPVEILIDIAKLVKHFPDQGWNIFKRKYRNLFSLSQVHRKLREACLGAGLFDSVTPKCIQYKLSAELGHVLFRTDETSLRSLGIDLKNTEVWPLCDVIMKLFPYVEELSFTGNMRHYGAELFEKSVLGSKVTNFGGPRLRLWNCCFTPTHYRFFLMLPRENITQLDFDSSLFQDSFGSYTSIISRPIFPNLKKVRFHNASTKSTYTANTLAEHFLKGCKITHFEIHYNLILQCCGEKDHKSGWKYEQKKIFMEKQNLQYTTIKNAIMTQLEHSSHDSLGVFIVNDNYYLEGVFMFRDSRRRRFQFTTLKLVVIKWEDVSELIEVEWPWSTQQCRTVCYFSDNGHHHSPWRHLADEYSYFCKCDCVLLKTKPSYYRWRTVLPNSFWETVATRFLARVWLHERQRPALRYFIVGNAQDGYQGIERYMKPPFQINPKTREVALWSYNHMTGAECKRLIDERLDNLQICF